MFERREEIVPVVVSQALDAGQIVEYDAATHNYKALAAVGNACGILLEAVTLDQDPAKALVGFAGEFMDSEVTLSETPATKEDQLNALRDRGIFVTERSEVI
jgi:hypothetical protein